MTTSIQDLIKMSIVLTKSTTREFSCSPAPVLTSQSAWDQHHEAGEMKCPQVHYREVGWDAQDSFNKSSSSSEGWGFTFWEAVCRLGGFSRGGNPTFWISPQPPLGRRDSGDSPQEKQERKERQQRHFDQKLKPVRRKYLSRGQDMLFISPWAGSTDFQRDVHSMMHQSWPGNN